MRFIGAVFVALVIIEVAAAVAVAHVISWPFTLLLLVGLSLVGVDLLRREGWAAFRGRRQQQAPERQLAGAAVGVIAAGLVAVPGFVTGVVGLVALTPPGRTVLGRALAHRFAARMTTVSGWQRTSRSGADPRVVDSTLDDPAEHRGHDLPVDLRKEDRTL